ncbi:MAG: hypothetical protein ACKVUS_07170 [Saprospiraceae bacterium]
MTKYLTGLFALCMLYSCSETPTLPGNAHTPPAYKKTDLQKLRWIEGNWKSEVAGPGFYQLYHFPTDSTLEVVSYQFNGKDTSATTLATVYWKNDHLYLGPNGEWVAVLLDGKSFQLDPVRDGWHSIHWTQNSQDEWTAVQKKPEVVRTIKMKRQPPLTELMKK